MVKKNKRHKKYKRKTKYKTKSKRKTIRQIKYKPRRKRETGKFKLSKAGWSGNSCSCIDGLRPSLMPVKYDSTDRHVSRCTSLTHYMWSLGPNEVKPRRSRKSDCDKRSREDSEYCWDCIKGHRRFDPPQHVMEVD